MKILQPITINHLDVIIAPNIHNRLRWKEYQILSLLVENSPKAVTRSEFISHIWKGTYCSDSTINQTIKSIRKKIGDNEHKIIKTVPRIGYIIEEKHRVNIQFNDNNDSSDTIPAEQPLQNSISSQQEPAEQAKRVESTEQYVGVNSANANEETTFSGPIWTLPSPSQSPTTVESSRLVTPGKFQGFIDSCGMMILNNKNKFFITFLSFFILLIIALCIFSIVKKPARPYANFDTTNRTTAMTLSCPLGYIRTADNTYSCQNVTIVFDGPDYNDKYLTGK